MGQSGYFGFKFTSGANTFYGWGEIVLAPALTGTRGHEFQFSRLYYENTGAPIAIGDTVGAIPEPSTCALALLAAGGVAAYRARRRLTRSE